MSIGTTAGVQKHLISVHNLGQEDLTHAVEEGDTLLNAHLSAIYEMPLQTVGGIYPYPLALISEHLGASRILETKYAISSQGAADNPLNTSLTQVAMDLIARLHSGEIVLAGNTRIGTVPTSRHADTTGLVRTVRQLGHTGSGG